MGKVRAKVKNERERQACLPTSHPTAVRRLTLPAMGEVSVKVKKERERGVHAANAQCVPSLNLHGGSGDE